MPDSIVRGIALLRKAAESKPDPRITTDLMMALCGRNQGRDAVVDFIGFVERLPEATQLHHDMLLTLGRNAGFANEMFQGFQLAAKERGDDSYLVQYALGLLYASLGMHEEALAPYEESIRLNSHFAPAYHNLGLSYQFSADLKEPMERDRRRQKALSLCRLATEKSHTLAEPHYFIAVMEMNSHPESSLMHFLEFVRLAKPYLENYIPKAQISMQLLREKLGMST